MTDKQDLPPLPELTNERILHLQEIHVGDPAPRYPLTTADWINFARAVIADDREAIRSHEAERGAQEHAVAAFDVAVSEELPLVSHVHYDSHEICKHFAGEVRKRLLAAEASNPVQAEAPSTVIHQHGFAADNNRLRVINESLDKQLEEVMAQRDEREDVIDKILDLVLGDDREEWSSAYGFADAINDVDERMAALATPPTASPVGERLHGFKRHDLETMADGLEAYERTIDTGDGHVESTTAWAARFIRAALATQSQAAYIAELERRLGECEGALETQTKVYDGKPLEQKPVHPNHRADLRYVLQVLERITPVVKVHTLLREQVHAAITGMRYVIDRTESAAQPEQVAQDGDLLALLEEVSRHYTREDDLPDNLLPRIDAAIDAARTRGEGA